FGFGSLASRLGRVGRSLGGFGNVGGLLGLGSRGLGGLAWGFGSRQASRSVFELGLVRLGSLGLGGFGQKVGRIALDEHTLLAHLDLDGARTPRTVGLADFGGLTARKRDLLSFGSPVGTP